MGHRYLDVETYQIVSDSPESNRGCFNRRWGGGGGGGIVCGKDIFSESDCNFFQIMLRLSHHKIKSV